MRATRLVYRRYPYALATSACDAVEHQPPRMAPVVTFPASARLLRSVPGFAGFIACHLRRQVPCRTAHVVRSRLAGT